MEVMKKDNIKIIIVNVVLGFINLFIMAAFSLAAFLDDYVEPLTKFQQYSTYFIGVAIAVVLDLLVNYVLIKRTYNKFDKLKYLKIVVISLIIIVLEAIYLLKG